MNPLQQECWYGQKPPNYPPTVMHRENVFGDRAGWIVHHSWLDGVFFRQFTYAAFSEDQEREARAYCARLQPSAPDLVWKPRAKG